MLSRVSLPSAPRYISREAFSGRFLTKINEGRPAIGEAREQETAPAEISGNWISDCERKSDCDRRVDCVAAGPEDRRADIGGNRLFCDHHAAPCTDRLTRPCRLGDAQYEQGSQNAGHTLILRHSPFPLEQNDPCGDGDIERGYSTCHRNPDQGVTVIADQLMETLPFST